MKQFTRLITFMILLLVLFFITNKTYGGKTASINAYSVQTVSVGESEEFEWDLRIDEDFIVWWNAMPEVYPRFTVRISGDNFEKSFQIDKIFFSLLPCLDSAEPGIYDITITPFWGGIPESEPLKVYYDGNSGITPATTLPIPNNLRQEQDLLMWDLVQEATGYSIMIVESIYPKVSSERSIFKIDNPYYPLDDFALLGYDEGEYYFSVQSMGGNGYLASGDSEFTVFSYNISNNSSNNSNIGGDSSNGNNEIDNGDSDINGRMDWRGILLFSIGGLALIAVAMISTTALVKHKNIRLQSTTEPIVQDKFNLDTCTEEELRKRCRERFKRDIEYKTERAVKHFILKLPHSEIDKNPKQSQMERMRMRKTLK